MMHVYNRFVLYVHYLKCFVRRNAPVVENILYAGAFVAMMVWLFRLFTGWGSSAP